MLDIRKLRENPEGVQAALRQKDPQIDLSEFRTKDQEWRELQTRLNDANQFRNQVSKEVEGLKRKGQPADEAILRGREAGARITEISVQLKEVETRLNVILAHLPNLPAPGVPEGRDASANRMVRSFGGPREFPFAPKTHYELAESMKLLDFPRGVKLAGHGFMVFTGAGARLVRALLNFMLDRHTQDGKYREVFPPFLANRACMEGTGQVPRLEKDMYRLLEDEGDPDPSHHLFLIPTAEVPLTNLYREEILSHKDLPIRLAAYTACFRKEAGAWGKDVRGLTRVHQFDKVELVKLVDPATSCDELESLVADAEGVLQALGLHYRVMLLCAGDMSFSAAKCYDLEVHAPGAGRYLEVSSCSNFEDFQARRAQLKFRGTDGKTRFLHTLNGSGTAIPRLFIALLEHGQQEDGTVRLPPVLAPYLGGRTLLTQAGLV